MIVPGRPTRRVEIERDGRAGRSTSRDAVSVEEPLEIRVRFRRPGATAPERVSVAVTMRTPGDDFELAAGFLLTEGLVRERTDILKLTYCTSGETEQEYNIVEVRFAPGVVVDTERLTRHFHASASCGICGKVSLEAVEVRGCRSLVEDEVRFEAEMIRAMPARLLEGQRVFGETGGVHAAGLFDSSGALVGLWEDVGRHNALDKLVGHALLDGRLPLSGTMVGLSGRASFEMVQKAVMAGIPVVAAVGAPSTLAVDAARRFGVTLIGFARGDGFNIYSGAGRVV